MRDGGDVKDGIRLGQRVIAGVVAERPFVAQRLVRVNVTFDDEVGVGGNFQVVGLALHQFDGFFAEITGEEKFIQAVRQRRGGGEGEHRVAAEENRHGHARAGFVIAPSVPRADFLQLPVHAGGAVVVNLDAIHADVAFAGVGVARDDAGQRDEASAVERPALVNGEVQQSRTGRRACPLSSGTRLGPGATPGAALRMSGAFGHGSVRVGGASNL